MVRAPNEKATKAYELYKKGSKLIDIAKELDVPSSTIRSWKKRYNWCDEKLQKRTNNKCNVAKENNSKRRNKKESIVSGVESVLDNTDLTDKQRLFCIYYIKYFNAVKAYQKAYKVNYNTASSIAYRLMENDRILEEIKRLKRNKFNQVMLSTEDIFQRYVDIACSDITDFVDFGTKEVDMYDEEGRRGKIDVTYTIAKNSNEVDGTLISEISNNSKGLKIKLQDRMRALQWLSEHMELATTEQKIRIEKIKAETELLKVRKEKAEEEW